MAEAAFLELAGVDGFYGQSHVLHGVSMQVGRGEAVSLIGRNGAGKTSTMRAIMGLMPARRGSIKVKGHETIALPPERIARLGVGYVPEERGIYASLDVMENLMLPPVVGPGGADLAELFRLFPNLEERRRSRGNRLSGGEQQMLAIARVMRSGADLFLFDEPTEGIAPVIVQQITAAILSMKKKGNTILLVEQNFHVASRIADRHFLMENGHIVDVIARADLERKSDLIRSTLGI